MELPITYLKEKTTFDEVLADNVFKGMLEGAWEDWDRLCAKRRDGDELWRFEPPTPEAIQLWGYALVRDGKVVSTAVSAVD